MLLTKSQETFKYSRYHDLLVCCFHLFLNDFTVKITFPECLKMDQTHRTYLLTTLKNYSKVKKLDFYCYSGYQTYYVSEEERILLKEALISMKELTLIKLPNVANNDILQA